MRYDTAIPLGRGGVGEVFKAFDPSLQRFVALKYLRRDDPELAARLLREARLQARVDHELVCKVYEVGDDDGRPFIAMEYIEGRTLEDCAAELSLEERLRVVQGVAQGVHAAHETGLVHRDLKPQNVMVERSAGGLRPHVLDFGLARERQAPGLTESGVIAGTPAYMPPEQARGQVHALDRRSDVYALGAILYRLLAGRPPFEGGSDLEVAMRVVSEEPPPLRTRGAPGVSAELQSVVLRCLEKDPARRYPTALALAEDLGRLLRGEPVSARPVGWPARAWRRVRRSPAWSASIAALAVAALALGAGLALRSPWQGHAAGPLRARRSFAVLGLRDVSGRPETAWIGTALTEMLTTELSAGGRLRAVPGETVARVRAELALPESETLAGDSLARLRQGLNAELLVVGSYVALGTPPDATVRLDLRVQDMTSAETVALAAESGSAASLPELSARLAARLREALTLAPLTPDEEAAVQGAFAASPEAMRLYAEGLARLRSFDVQGARQRLEQAVAAAPSSALPRRALSEAWARLGYLQRAKAEARLAFERAAGLPREQGLLVEGHYREQAREWPRALEIYKTLFVFFPDNLEFGLKLAHAQSEAGQAEEALATVAGLRRLPAPQNEDPRIDLCEADGADLVSQYDRELQAARRAFAKAGARGARLLGAEARVAEGWALARKSRYAEALAAYADARRVFAEVGDRWGLVRASGNAANTLWEQGDLDAAQRAYGELLTVVRGMGNVRAVAVIANNLGNLISDRGELQEARRMQEDALAAFRETEDRPNAAIVLNNLGLLVHLMGDLERGEVLVEEAVALRRELGDVRGVASSLVNLGSIRRARGDLAAAQAAGDEAEALARQVDSKNALARALELRGEGQLEAGDLAGARRSHAEALALRQELELKGPQADSRVDLAQVDLEAGDPAAAESGLRAALQEFAAEKRRDEEAEARALLARALLALGRTAEAGRESEAAAAAAQSSQAVFLKLGVLLARAEVEGATGHAPDARRHVQEVRARAAAAGHVPLELRARLLQAELAAPSAGPVGLAALERETRRRGFGLLARRAARAAAGSGPELALAGPRASP